MGVLEDDCALRILLWRTWHKFRRSAECGGVVECDTRVPLAHMNPGIAVGRTGMNLVRQFLPHEYEPRTHEGIGNSCFLPNVGGGVHPLEGHAFKNKKKKKKKKK